MTLPTLALRGVSVFPGTVLHFDVERPMSIAALNAAIGTDRMIFLVAQRDIACDTPRADDLYTVGHDLPPEPDPARARRRKRQMHR